MALFLVAACGQGGGAVAEAPTKEVEGVAEPSAQTLRDASAPDAGAVTCRGTLLDRRGEPVVGRPVVVVDARGKRLELMSDEAGVFHALDVVRPYDVAIARAPSGPVVVPVAHLGLTRLDAVFALDEAAGGTAPAESQVLSIAVAAPPCASARCRVSVVSVSPSGAGASSRAFDAGAPVVTVDTVHAWTSATIPESEEISVHVLVGEDAGDAYAYGHASEITASPGDRSDVELACSTIPSSPPVAIQRLSADVPAGWSATVGARIDLPDGAAIDVRTTGTARALRLPLVPLATTRAAVWAEEPASSRAHAHVLEWSSFGWSAPLAGATRADVPASAGAVLTRPGVDGALSRRGRGLAWTSPSGALVTASLRDVVRGRDVVRVYTASRELAWKRLTRLGIELPEPGEHLVELETRGDMTPDDRVAPPTGAPRAASGVTSGWTSLLRRRFVVTQ